MGSGAAAAFLGVLLVCDPYAVSGGLGGAWGGQHIRLEVTDKGARAEFDCAAGVIEEPIAPDREGNFEQRGIYVYERGGPRHPADPPPKRHPAVYRGWTDGAEMRLTVSLTEGNKEIGTFTLGRGREAVLEKCL